MVEPLTAAACAVLVRDARAVVVDLREPADFSAGHPRGAISLRYDARHLAERLAAVLSPASEVIVLSADRETADAAAAQLQGSFRVHARALPDPAFWRACEVDWEPLPAMESAALAAGGDQRLHVLDVREPMEWATGHVPGAQLIALGALRDRLAELPRDRELAVICEAGVRSATAASLLLAAGFARVINVSDGTAGYRRGKHPLQITDTPEGHSEEDHA